MRLLARELSGPSANNQQASIEDSLEEILGQDEAQPASNKAPSRTKKPAKKHSTTVKKTSTTKSQPKASRTVDATSAPLSEEITTSLESSDEQTRKRKSSNTDLDEPASKKLSTQDGDQGSVLSELSALGETPEHPGVLGNESLEEQHVVENEHVEVDTIPAVHFTLDKPNLLVESGIAASNSPPAATPKQPEFSGEDSLDKQPTIPSLDLEANVVATIEPEPAAPSSLVESAADSSTPRVAPVEERAEEQAPSGSVAGSARANSSRTSSSAPEDSSEALPTTPVGRLTRRAIAGSIS
jgi:hypothetical protein